MISSTKRIGDFTQALLSRWTRAEDDSPLVSFSLTASLGRQTHSCDKITRARINCLILEPKCTILSQREKGVSFPTRRPRRIALFFHWRRKIVHAPRSSTQNVFARRNCLTSLRCTIYYFYKRNLVLNID